MTQEQINRKRERDREAKRRKRAAAREAASKPVEAFKDPAPIPGPERPLETAPKADPSFRIPLDCFEVHMRRLERERRA